VKPLTNRQLEFLALSARGMLHKQIAEKCCVTIDTVTSAFSEARKRLGTNTTLQLYAMAISREELGLDHNGVTFVPIRD
jgi:DNA-binding NarL/FixJ family response regulator